MKRKKERKKKRVQKYTISDLWIIPANFYSEVSNISNYILNNFYGLYIHFVIITTLQGRHYYPHCTNEETTNSLCPHLVTSHLCCLRRESTTRKSS